MAATKRATPDRHAGDTWLANCSRRPDVAHDAWSMGALVPIHSTRWLVAEMQLATALQAVQRIPPRKVGPLLIDVRLFSGWWLVPLDGDEHLVDVRHVTVLPRDWPLHCPPTTRAVSSRVWLEAPVGSGRLVDAALLAAALGPGSPRLPAEAFG